jgi:hypothetical protein
MLDHKVTLYVPGTQNGTTPNPVGQARWTHVTAFQFGSWFGGSTITDSQGTWNSPEHGMIREPVKLVASYTDAAGLLKNRQNVTDLAAHLGFEMGQEAVAVEIDGQMEFINPLERVAAEAKLAA